MNSQANAQVELRDIGPIQRLVLSIPTDGGVCVLRGANGSGKSTALEAIDAAITGKGKPPVRDGALNGLVQAHGVTLTIGRSARRTGEAEVHSLAGRFSIAELVDPGIADPEKADAHRIKALVHLAGCKADPALFHPLVADLGEFDSLVSPSALTHTDLITMASAIKRDLEAAARKAEGEATNANSRAEACRKTADGIDVSEPHDLATIQAELEAAIRHKAKLEAENAAAQKAFRAAEQGKAAIAKAESEYTGPSTTDAEAALHKAQIETANRHTDVLKLENALADARIAYSEAKAEQSQRQSEFESAKAHSALLTQWKHQVAIAAQIKPIRPSEIPMAQAAVETAQEQLQKCGVIARALEQLGKANEYASVAKEKLEHAEKLRGAAKGTDDVLSALVGTSGVPLKVEPVDNRMRLTLDTRRGRTCFGELSDGERWRIALDIAIQAVGRGGEITLCQSAWEGLDATNRAAIAKQAKEGGIIIYTAESDIGDLRAEVFEGGNGHA